MRFRAQVELGGKTATGIAVPDEVVIALDAGRRPPVTVTVGGHSYRTTVASMGGRFMVPLSAQNRAAAGVAAGDEVEVEVVGDTAPRQVTVPDDLTQALAADPVARAFFDELAPSHRKEWVRWIEEAKQAQTRATRLTRTIAALQAGQRTR
ncbi:MAG: YdeI/OmpD-associated family protein [Humibacillus sp.]|nr:YdeI/OmpD-associated family protein [Humibacillus sp.]MDN5778597.1 YdeI/OmpD-associated family protein [Humibacillus sp.]